jgi:hypothetical protein
MGMSRGFALIKMKKEGNYSVASCFGFFEL